MKGKLSLPLLASITALTPLAVDMYLPAIPGIAKVLNADISVIQNSLSIFLIGFALGLFVFGPFCDRFGRRPMILFGLLGSALASFFIAISTSAEMFLTFRLLQGFLGSAASVAVPAMIRDCYGKNTAKGLSSVTMIMLLAPLIAPLAGSFLLTLGEGDIIFYFLGAYGVIVFFIALRNLPETRPVTNNSHPPTFFGNYKIILAKRIIYLDLLCFMLTSFTFFTYLTSSSFIYISFFEMSETAFGILFATTASSLIAANYINVRVVNRQGPRKMMQIGLGVGILGAALLVLSSLLHLGVYWILACFVLIIGSLGLASINASSLVLIEFPNQASSASAVTGTLRFGTGALAGPVLALIYDGTLLPIAIMIFLTLCAAGIAQTILAKLNQAKT